MSTAFHEHILRRDQETKAQRRSDTIAASRATASSRPKRSRASKKLELLVSLALLLPSLIAQATEALTPTERLHTDGCGPTTDKTLLQRVVLHKLSAKDGERIHCAQILHALQEPMRCFACFRVELLLHVVRFAVLHEGFASKDHVVADHCGHFCNAAVVSFRWVFTCWKNTRYNSEVEKLERSSARIRPRHQLALTGAQRLGAKELCALSTPAEKNCLTNARRSHLLSTLHRTYIAIFFHNASVSTIPCVKTLSSSNFVLAVLIAGRSRHADHLLQQGSSHVSLCVRRDLRNSIKNDVDACHEGCLVSGSPGHVTTLPFWASTCDLLHCSESSSSSSLRVKTKLYNLSSTDIKALARNPRIQFFHFAGFYREDEARAALTKSSSTASDPRWPAGRSCSNSDTAPSQLRAHLTTFGASPYGSRVVARRGGGVLALRLASASAVYPSRKVGQVGQLVGVPAWGRNSSGGYQVSHAGGSSIQPAIAFSLADLGQASWVSEVATPALSHHPRHLQTFLRRTPSSFSP